jgi:hypothetical protein
MTDIEGRLKRLRDMASSADAPPEMQAMWGSSMQNRSVSTDSVFVHALPTHQQQPLVLVDSGESHSKMHKLTQQNRVLDAALRDEKVKSEKLAQEVRAAKIALAKEKQAKVPPLDHTLTCLP